MTGRFSTAVKNEAPLGASSFTPYLCRDMLISQRPEAVLLWRTAPCSGPGRGGSGHHHRRDLLQHRHDRVSGDLHGPQLHRPIMTMATAHVGNYGVKDEEVESGSVKIAGLVVKKFSEVWSRPGGHASLDDYLKRHGIVGISDVDTRQLVRHIRDHGAQNALISTATDDLDGLRKQLASVPSMEGLELSSRVTSEEPWEEGPEDAAHRVALVDFGVKLNIVRCLTERGCRVRCSRCAQRCPTCWPGSPTGSC